MWNDLRFALRVLRRSPGFVAVGILSLALGIGANTAISSLLYQVAVRSIPVADPERLVALESAGDPVGWTRRDNRAAVFSKPMYEALRDHTQVFDGLVARAAFPATLAYRGPAINAQAEVVSGNFFEVLGVRPAIGRLLARDDDRSAADPVVVLSHDYWQNRLGGDAGVLKRSILLNGHPVPIVGVAPAGFRSLLAGSNPDLFAPLSMMRVITTSWNLYAGPSAYWLNLVGRLRRGIPARRADAELLPLFRSILRDELPLFSDVDEDARKRILNQTIRVTPAAQGLNELRRQWQAPLLVLSAMTGMVLLIACANVANLLLAKSAARQREIAVRLAMGATRAHLIRQSLVESMLLALMGGLLGILISRFATQGLLGLLPADATGGWLSGSLDGRLIAYGFAVSVLTGIVFGLVPAWGAARSQIAPALKEQSSGLSAGGAQGQVRRVLVAAQIGLSLLLLIAAGLFTRSLYNLLTQNVGFEPDRLITFSVDPSLNGYGRERRLAFFRDLRERLSELGGVRSVASSELAPFGGSSWGSGVKAPGTRAATDRYVSVQENAVSPGYFATLGSRLLSGREFTTADTAAAHKVAIVSRTLAQYLFQNENPIGRHLIVGADSANIEIVGVVADSQYAGVRDAPERFVYAPYEQQDDEFTRQASFFVRTRGQERAVMNAISAAVKQMDANIPVQRLQTMNQLIRDSVRTDRLLAILAVAFGILAAMLAAIGLYGTISYAVTRRTREFGIRIALGAVRSRILKLVLLEVGSMLAVGVGAGLPVSYALARLVESQLFGIRAHDPLVLAGALVVTSFVAMAAGLIPGARAMRIEPVRALKHE